MDCNEMLVGVRNLCQRGQPLVPLVTDHITSDQWHRGTAAVRREKDLSTPQPLGDWSRGKKKESRKGKRKGREGEGVIKVCQAAVGNEMKKTR